MISPEIAISSPLPDLRASWGQRVLLGPIAQLKQALEAVYYTLLSLIWSEVTGKTTNATLMWLSQVFLLICVFSLGLYWLQDYEAWIFLGFLALWWGDRGITRWHYFRGTPTAWARLVRHGDRLLYSLRAPGKPVWHRDFSPTQIAQLTLTHSEVRGGAFRAQLGYVWRVYITLRDQTQCLVYEEPAVTVALQRARWLAQQLAPLAVPVQFAASTGTGPHAADRLPLQIIERYRRRLPPTVGVQQTPQGYRLRSRWTLGSVGQFLREVLQASGFLLFVLMMSEVMESFGGFLYRAAIVYGDSEATRQVWLQTVRLLDLTPDWSDLAEVAIALMIMAVNAWHISREEAFVITPERLLFSLHGRRVAVLQTPQIHSILHLHNPHPLLLLLDEQQAVLVSGLQTELEFQAFWVRLADAITALQGGELE